jgi:hypothetical protein
MSAQQASLRGVPAGHLHVAGEVCPYCDQPIPNERAQEIHERYKAKEREQAEAFAQHLNEQIARERERVEQVAKAQVEKIQSDSVAAVEAVKSEAAAQQNAAREEGKKIAEAAAQSQMQALRDANEHLKLITAEQLAEANRQREKALQDMESLKADQEKVIGQRTTEVREAMEKDKLDAVNTVKAQHFEETLKLNEMVQTLQRRLEQKNAEELGEGAEIDLFEALKAEFPDDRIRRIAKGEAGADILHAVLHNGKECGVVVYDSKNRKAWRDSYVTKLREDQMAAKAEHAILSTCKFPAKANQLEIRDGVIIANPARVVVLAQVLRNFIVQSHSLRVSGKERSTKTAALYSYITSERFRQHLDSLDTHADKMLAIDVSEKKAHEAVWENRGRVVKAMQKVHGNLTAEIERIIGTADSEST